MHCFSAGTLRISFFCCCLFSKSVSLTPADRFSLLLPSLKWPREDLPYNFHLPWGESLKRPLQARSCWGLNATRHLLPFTLVPHFIQLTLLLRHARRCASRSLCGTTLIFHLFFQPGHSMILLAACTRVGQGQWQYLTLVLSSNPSESHT